jgi:hypothetical protein
MSTCVLTWIRLCAGRGWCFSLCWECLAVCWELLGRVSVDVQWLIICWLPSHFFSHSLYVLMLCPMLCPCVPGVEEEVLCKYENIVLHIVLSFLPLSVVCDVCAHAVSLGSRRCCEYGERPAAHSALIPSFLIGSLFVTYVCDVALCRSG